MLGCRICSPVKPSIRRVYEAIVEEHLRDNWQMAFLSGPRQSGKTTLAELFATKYFNWDDVSARTAIALGQGETVKRFGLDALSADMPVVVFDEFAQVPALEKFLEGIFRRLRARATHFRRYFRNLLSKRTAFRAQSPWSCRHGHCFPNWCSGRTPAIRDWRI